MSGEFWKITVPVVAAIIIWSLTEWRKRAWEQYQRKEEKYKELVRCSRGFYEVGTTAESAEAEELKGDFLEQLKQCWLYCSDEVIRKGYAFLDTVHTDEISSDKIKEKAMGDFVAAIREDLLPRKLGDLVAAMREGDLPWKLSQRTNLTGSDFRHFAVVRKR